MKKSLILTLIIIVFLAGAGIWYADNRSISFSPSPIAQATYICNGDKTIDAAFYRGEPKPVEPGEPPIPSGSVKIILSDGRSFDLPQTISADGSRYANSNESFIFWSKGSRALVLEDNVEKNYIGCIVIAKDPGGLPKTYSDGAIGFSIRYPADYSIDTSYKYQALGPGKDINGVKFTIPYSLAVGTNLSSFDTGISIETIPAAQDCSAGLFLDGNTDVQTVTDNGIDYSFATTIQGAAGNRYEEEVWAIPETNPCLAIRYFIHSTNIENYPEDPEGVILEFDRPALINQFEKIRHTLTTP